MRKKFLVCGIDNVLIQGWSDLVAEDLKPYIERCEEIRIKVKLNPIEAFVAKKQIKKYNEEHNSNIRLSRITREYTYRA